ncbi:transposase [Cupriavidus basilensis]
MRRSSSLARASDASTPAIDFGVRPRLLTAIVASIGNGSEFKRARDLASWAGLSSLCGSLHRGGTTRLAGHHKARQRLSAAPLDPSGPEPSGCGRIVSPLAADVPSLAERECQTDCVQADFVISRLTLPLTWPSSSCQAWAD